VNKLRQIPTIISKNGSFQLRPFRFDVVEAAALMDQLSDSGITERVSNIPSPYTEEDALFWLQKMHDIQERISDSSDYCKAPERIDFVIDVGGELAGSIAFINIDGHKAQLSYWLAKNHQGKGIMTEAVRMMLAFGFNTCGFWKIYGYTWPGNRASQAVLERAGFDVDHVIRAEWFKKGVLRDSVVYAKFCIPDCVALEKETRYRLMRVDLIPPV
jgi:[ribosomal protein S5]-alanine N-acetyltransferase